MVEGLLLVDIAPQNFVVNSCVDFLVEKCCTGKLSNKNHRNSCAKIQNKNQMYPFLPPHFCVNFIFVVVNFCWYMLNTKNILFFTVEFLGGTVGQTAGRIAGWTSINHDGTDRR